MKATIIAKNTPKETVFQYLFGGAEYKQVKNDVYIFYDNKGNLDDDIESLSSAPFDSIIKYKWPESWTVLKV